MGPKNKMSDRDEQELALHLHQIQAGIKTIFMQGFSAGLGANIHKGEDEAVKLAIRAGIAMLKRHTEGFDEAADVMQELFDAEVDKIFGKKKPKLEVVPANVLGADGALIN